MTHIWYWKKILGTYRGKACKLLKVGKLNNVLIEFEDGFKVITNRRGLRRMMDRSLGENKI